MKTGVILLVMLCSIGGAYQIPVIYIDSLDVIQANIANQKLTEWITENEMRLDTVEVDVDTLHNRSDSIQVRIDSVQTRIDSVQTRIDSVQTRIDSVQVRIDSSQTRLTALENSRDSICYVWDDAGGQVIPTLEGRLIYFDSEKKDGGIYSHPADGRGVEVSSPGWYRITFGVSALMSSSGYEAPCYCQLKKWSTAWSVIGIRSYDYAFDASLGEASMSGVWIDTLSDGDSLGLYLYNGSAVQTLETELKSPFLLIEKIH